MADSKKFWRESIGTGVVPPARRAPTRRGTSPEGTPAAAGDGGRANGTPGDAEMTGPVGPERTAGPFAIEVAGPVVRPRNAALDAVEQILASLPSGSIAFTSQVAARLWPDPEPVELRHLGKLVAERYQVRSATIREALTRTVLARQRLRRLLSQAGETPLDSGPLDARAKEWRRLHDICEELRILLQSAPSVAGSEAVTAALALLPETELLTAETELAETCAHLVAVLRGEAARDPHLDPPAVDDAVSLRGAIREGRARPGDALFLEVWAAAGLARRDLLGDDRPRLEHERRVLARVHSRIETVVERAAQSSMLDRAGAKRLLAWRRYLEEICDRLDTRLAPPPPAAAEPAPKEATPAVNRAPQSAASDPGGRLSRATSKLKGLFRR